MSAAEAYPLAWPSGWPRTPEHEQQRARFSKAVKQERVSRDWQGKEQVQRWTSRGDLSVADALKRLRGELTRLGAEGVVISTNVELRQDGLPYSNRREPADPGVAVYFTLKREPYCLPCDTFDRVADNLAAVAGHIDCMRAMERYGVGSTAARFAGFKALPPRGGTTVGADGPSWWDVLAVSKTASLDVVKVAYRAAAMVHHPDCGGDAGAMATINRAWEQAQAALGR